MLGLGSYAVANFAISGAGYFTSEEESSKRFHEMNVMWNTVNIGLALPGYIKARRGGQPMTREELLKAQKKTESIFLFNDVLDVGYIAAGIWMREVAPNQLDQEDLFKGYGNSLILQDANTAPPSCAVLCRNVVLRMSASPPVTCSTLSCMSAKRQSSTVK